MQYTIVEQGSNDQWLVLEESRFDPEVVQGFIDYLKTRAAFKMDMNYWIRGDIHGADDLRGTSVESILKECGTAACGAGHAVVHFDPYAVFDGYEGASSGRMAVLVDRDDDERVRVSIDRYAAYKLGLTTLQASRLFSLARWPRWARELAYRTTQLNAFIAILERAIQENTWDVVVSPLE